MRSTGASQQKVPAAKLRMNSLLSIYMGQPNSTGVGQFFSSVAAQTCRTGDPWGCACSCTWQFNCNTTVNSFLIKLAH